VLALAEERLRFAPLRGCGFCLLEVPASLLTDQQASDAPSA
jgi:hypothetical protein